MDDAHPPVSDQEAREAVAGPQTHEASLVGLRPSTALVAVVLSVAVAAGGAVSALINYDLVGLGHLPRVGVFIVFVLIAVNALSMVIVRRRALSSGQIAFIYMAILVMAGIPGQQLVTYLYLGMIGSQYYAYGQGNDYATEVIPYLKPWLVPSMDPEGPVIAWAFHGLPWGESIPWQAWVRPLACWTPYILALLGLQICLASLFRRRWDQERLTYPLARVPVELASYRTGADAVPELLRSRLFWAAFVLPVAVYTQKALSFHNPDIRGVNLYKDIGVVFGAAPWSNLDYLPLHIYFESIGATYLIPTSVGFSLWFFWLFRRLIYVYRDMRGLMDHPQYLTQQGIGAYAVLAGLCLWGSRKTLMQGIRGMIGLRQDPDTDPESPHDRHPMKPAAAMWGIVVCLVVIVAWGRAAGVGAGPVLVTVGLYVIGLIVVCRLVAEMGLFAVWTPMFPPQEITAKLWGTFSPLDQQSTTGLCYLGWKIQDSASATVANVLQGFKISELSQLKDSSGLWLMVVALLAAILAAHPASIHAIYNQGVYDLGWWPSSVGDDLAAQIHSLSTVLVPYKREAYEAMAHGALIVTGLHLLRTHYHRFPLLAFAYGAALGPQFMMDRYGFSIFIGWCVKSALLKYGGISTHNRVRPAALGLICGNACVLMFWTIVHYFAPVSGVLVTE
ncbi:MAG: hypothetical protein KBA64_04305 [Armatimonadetes bacterium]|jgi:hypothetical protein|nr:hypothetical protein [Armatimonadota bacterium]MDI9601055.1 hypothetical protein [Acidobacteriota bacterium]